MGSITANFSERFKDTLPVKDKSHTTPESAPGAGDLKTTCDDSALQGSEEMPQSENAENAEHVDTKTRKIQKMRLTGFNVTGFR